MSIPKTVFTIINHIEIREVEIVGFSNNSLTGNQSFNIRWEEGDTIRREVVYFSQISNTKEGIIDQLKKFNNLN